MLRLETIFFSRNDLNQQLDKEDKNIHDCMVFIHHELYFNIIKKNYKEEGLVPIIGEDNYIFNTVVHYLDEDIDMDKINKEMKGVKFVIPGEQKAARDEKIIEKEISKKYEARYKKIKDKVAKDYMKELKMQAEAEKEKIRLEKEKKRCEKEQKKKALEGQLRLFEEI